MTDETGDEVPVPADLAERLRAAWNALVGDDEAGFDCPSHPGEVPELIGLIAAELDHTVKRLESAPRKTTGCEHTATLYQHLAAAYISLDDDADSEDKPEIPPYEVVLALLARLEATAVVLETQYGEAPLTSMAAYIAASLPGWCQVTVWWHSTLIPPVRFPATCNNLPRTSPASPTHSLQWPPRPLNSTAVSENNLAGTKREHRLR